MTSRENSSADFAPIDRWSQLDFHELLGEARIAFAEGRLEQVHTLCLVGLTRFPDSAPLLTVLGWVYAQRLDTANAEATFRHALCHDANSVDSHAGLAAVLAAASNFAAAVPHYQRALELNANDPHTLFNFGCTLLSLRRFDEAIDILKRSVQFDPTLADAFHNLAIAHAQLGRWENAGEFCERALALDSKAWQARLTRAMSRIALGSFADGWDDYEARCQLQDYYIRRLGLPRWEGPADRKQSIAVIPEQGVGTQILFASCFADLTGHVPHVTVGCEPRLVGLLRRSFPTVHVVAGGLLPELAKSGLFDCYLMAGSLPRVFRRSAQEFPGASYVTADPLTQARWRERLDAIGPGIKVGVSWGGGAQKSDASHRRTEPDNWPPLTAIENIHWINLQYDASPKELEIWQQSAGERFHDWHDFDRKHDLENLAGLVSQLDLVITVVNSTVHLAGALGTPTWTLVPFGGEWRWQTSGENCLWHRSVRLFRQQRLDDWTDVFARLRDELIRFADSTSRGDRRGIAA
ncbi:MAG: tetratricopeptide repeat-containing glycosyltransferase family protein [Pirellulales bacterium]